MLKITVWYGDDGYTICNQEDFFQVYAVVRTTKAVHQWFAKLQSLGIPHKALGFLAEEYSKAA
jgi:7,8-dihydro-6-hydroxymethylpterin-pyrophosphokinase